MPKLPRVTAKVYASNASSTDIAQFGSVITGSVVYTSDIAQIQALPAYETGWRAAVISDENYPTLVEFNGLQKTFSQQIAYLLQNGVPEYDNSTEYYIGSLCKGVGSSTLYESLVDNNIGNPLTDNTKWKGLPLGQAIWGSINGDINSQSDLMNILNTKADIELSNVTKDSGLRKLINLYRDGYSYYKVFKEVNPSDASIKYWCQQAGFLQRTSSSGTSVSLPIEYIDTNFLVLASHAGTNAYSCAFTNGSKNSIIVSCSASNGASFWKTEGEISEEVANGL